MIGDKVKCINPIGDFLNHDDVYSILDTSYSMVHGKRFDYIIVRNDNIKIDNMLWYNTDRFVSYTEPVNLPEDLFTL